MLGEPIIRLGGATEREVPMTRKPKDHLSPGMRRVVTQFKDDQMLEGLEVLRCSHCLEPLDKPEPVYEVRSPGPDPDDEWEVTDHYCVRCVKLDPTRKKQAQHAPPSEGGPRV